MEQDNSFVHSTLDEGEDIYLKDQWKREYHFRMAYFPAPTGLAFEAIKERMTIHLVTNSINYSILIRTWKLLRKYF